MLTQSDFDACEKELCERHLIDFLRQAWPQIDPGMPYVHGWHMDALAEHLEAVTRGEIKRLLINIPPGTSKSSAVSVYWPAWEWTINPTKRFIGASHEQSLAVRDSLKMRRLIESDWYQKHWPLELRGDNNQKMNFENTSSGFRQACAVRSMTGRRGDRIIWDDPLSVEDGYSPAALREAERIFRDTLTTRLVSPEHSAIVIVMQRLAERDVSGVILSDDFGYEHLCLPMEFEPSRKCVTSIGFEDPRKEDGELLFPERFPREVVDRDKKIMGSHAVAGQFQQRPSALGGGLIKGQWFGRYAIPPVIKFRKIFADTAQKTKERNDYSVFECWGLGEDGKIYLLDLLRGKWEAPDLKVNAKAFWAKHSAINASHSGRLRQMIVEDKASGTGLIQEIKREAKIPIKAQQRNTDKLTRVMDVTPFIQSGYVCIPESAPWLSDFVAECEAFSADDSHAHDDQIDPMIDAINDMLSTSGKKTFAVA
jgi:predicted phage terminase large subunit-like protein